MPAGPTCERSMVAAVILAAVASGTVACAPPPPDGAPAGSVAAATDGVFGVFPHEGVAALLEPGSGRVEALELGGEPTRAVHAGDRWIVTLRAERTLAVLESDGADLVELERVATGTEPLGIAARADGERVWVALSTEDAVVELDAQLEELRRFPVEGRPSWLALHPGGQVLYVAAAVGGGLSWIDLAAAEPAATPVEFPALIGASRAADLPFARRLTGDPTFDADGARLAVPGLWVDDVSLPGGGHGDQAGKYAALGLGLSPNNPGVALVDVDPDGRPVGAVTTVLYGEAWHPAGDGSVVRAYLSSARFVDDLVVATAEAADHVLVLDPTRGTPGAGGFTLTPALAVSTPGGPRGVAVDADGGAWVLAFLDRAIAPLPIADAAAGLAGVEPGQAPTVALTSGAAVVLTDVRLDPAVELGRRHFYAAADPRITLPSSGLSCSACHFEGRNDGMTWPVDTGVFQTPSLAGRISLTAPFTWVAEVPTVAEEARITSQERLGGTGGTDEDFAAIAAFLDWTRDIDHPERGGSSAETERGRALFARADVGCAGCHTGERYTNGTSHPMFDLSRVDTPSLVGIAATAPYFHDGRADTLRDVLEITRSGAMGDTSALSEAELADLEAYLRSL